MRAYFPSPGDDVVSPTQYSDADLLEISSFLREKGQIAWSKIPRIYTILRRIGELQYINDFVDLGVTDKWFPFSRSTLPDRIRPAVKEEYLSIQNVVLTKAFDLEKGDEGQHRYFADDECLPFKVLEYLGKGGFGTVDKVISTLSGRVYARKRIHRGIFSQNARRTMKDFETELSVLKRVTHSHIVEIRGSYTDSRYLALIMSPVADMDLAAFLALESKSAEERSSLRTFFGCLSSALAYLHDMRVRHKDIKPKNILIKGGRALFTDFGLALDYSALTRSTTTGSVAGMSPKYCAPEVANGEPRNSSSDVWSLACVFVEMLTVLRGATIDSMIDFFSTHGSEYTLFWKNPEAINFWMARLRLTEGLHVDHRPISWIRDMLQHDPRKRPNSKTVFEWTKNVQFAAHPRFPFCGACCQEEGVLDDAVESAENRPQNENRFAGEQSPPVHPVS